MRCILIWNKHQRSDDDDVVEKKKQSKRQRRWRWVITCAHIDFSFVGMRMKECSSPRTAHFDESWLINITRHDLSGVCLSHRTAHTFLFGIFWIYFSNKLKTHIFLYLFIAFNYVEIYSCCCHDNKHILQK